MRRVLVGFGLTILLVASGALASAQPLPPRLEGEWVILTLEGRDSDLSDLHLMRPDGSELVNLTNGTSADSQGAVSPDGTTIAMASNDGTLTSIWLMNVDGSERRRLTDGWGDAPEWTPDGLSIVYASVSSLRIINRNGEDDHELTTVAGAITQNPSVSPDGSVIVFDAQIDATRDLYSVPIGGGEAVKVTTEGGSEPEWAPDGASIVFTSFRRPSDGNFWVLDPESNAQRNLFASPHNDFHASWSPDGSRVIFESVQGAAFTIAVHDLATDTTVDLLSLSHEEPAVYRDPTWELVSLDRLPPPAEGLDESPEATAAATEATGLDAGTSDATATSIVLATDPAAGTLGPSGLMITLGAFLLIALSLGAGLMIGRRWRGDPPPPPAPPVLG